MSTRSNPFDGRARLALILVTITLVAGSVAFESAVRALNVVLQKKPVDLRDHFDNIPTRVGEWKTAGLSQKLSAEMVEELGTDLYLDRQYHLEDGRWIQLHLAYYTGMIDAVPHVPDRCLVAAGFNARSRPNNIPIPLAKRGWVSDPTDERYETVTFPDSVTFAPVTVRMPRGEFKLRTTEFSHDKMEGTRIYAGYFFIANGRVAVTPEDVKLIAFRKSEEYAYYCKVQILGLGDRDFTAEEFVGDAAPFLEDLLPEIMRCLPDWKTIEDLDTVVHRFWNSQRTYCLRPHDSEIHHGSAS